MGRRSVLAFLLGGLLPLAAAAQTFKITPLASDVMNGCATGLSWPDHPETLDPNWQHYYLWNDNELAGYVSVEEDSGRTLVFMFNGRSAPEGHEWSVSSPSQ